MSAPRNDLEVRGHAHPDENTWILHFAWPTNPLPMNGSRGNRHKASREERDVRAMAQTLAMVARIPHLDRCKAQVTWWVATRTVRDPDNLARLEKRLFDALVRADVVDDDRPELMDKPRAEIRHIPSTPGALLTHPGFTLTVTRLASAETGA
ncbi:hypothetical protein [Microbacterium excoecariae]|uniref:hypothetical protein n=1 Tax=Microbacterium excoecariae TaxID=2715210 RepID=UPI00140E4D83|nr:hypothetical protein [Microbacterium excoecariae]NHI16836.1 hypothetical protein [Microbacterium excoecariae]